MEKKNLIILILVILFIFAFSIFYFFRVFNAKIAERTIQESFKNNLLQNQVSKPSTTSKEEISQYNLPDEPVGFNVMSSPEQTPKFISGSFSRRVPLVKPGEEFEVKIELEDKKGVKNVVFVIQSEDKKIEREYKLQLEEGTTEKGTWKGVVKVTEEIPTIWYSYFKAENKEGKENTLIFNWK